MRYAGAACAVLLGAAACSFQPSGGESDAGGNLVDADETIDGAEPDGSGDVDAAAIDAPSVDAPSIDAAVPDAAPDAPVVADVVHVADDSIGTGDLVVAAPITVQTSGGGFGFGTTLPAGVTFTTEPQDPTGPELAVLRVRNLTISAGVRVVGTRPLVILADTITLGAVIDAGARQSTPGAGGATGGAGAGSPGGHMGSYGDSGGGGGSYGGAGGSGGTAVCASGCLPDQTVQGGAAGDTYGDQALAILRGGSGGGRSYFPPGQTQCTAGAPGAGGGAVQLAARTSITIGATGGINVGGGGGAGGDMCNNPYNWLAGHGGGSGGAIYLQAPTVQNGGILAANGGGGGGGAGANGDGRTGDDGALGTSVADGGAANGAYSAAGGDGAAGASTGETGANASGDGNGGGGGGGTGRIHVRYRTTYVGGTQSPTAVTSTY